MEIKQIIIFKESRIGEGRVALTPDAVVQLAKTGIPIIVESDAGNLAQFSNEEYVQAGARIFTLDAPLPPQSLILRVKCPTKDREILENSYFCEQTAMIGFLDPLKENVSHIARWKSLGLRLISLELLPLTVDDPKNAQAAMSRIAGRVALHDALNRYQGARNKAVTILGTGPAGIAIAYAASALNLPVQIFGRQKECPLHLAEMAGITYLALPKQSPREFLREYLPDQTIVITAARVIGQKAPLLIGEPEIQLLPDYCVIVDLSVGEGGSVQGSRSDETVTIERNISIVNVSGYPKAEPHVASNAFSDCMVQLLQQIIQNRKLDFNHPLLNDLS